MKRIIIWYLLYYKAVCWRSIYCESKIEIINIYDVIVGAYIGLCVQVTRDRRSPLCGDNVERNPEGDKVSEAVLNDPDFLREEVGDQTGPKHVWSYSR